MNIASSADSGSFIDDPHVRAVYRHDCCPYPPWRAVQHARVISIPRTYPLYQRRKVKPHSGDVCDLFEQ